jgi:hypothetical protein
MLGCSSSSELRALIPRDALTIALGTFAILALSVFVFGAIGCFHYEHIALDETLAAERAKQANADLQKVHHQMQDELASVQIALNALSEEVAAAEARNKASDELEQQLAAYEQRMARRTVAVQRRQSPSRRTLVAIVRTAATPVTQLSPLPVPSIALGIDAAQSKNFISPGWVPSYFSGESAPFLGSTSPKATGSPGL